MTLAAIMLVAAMGVSPAEADGGPRVIYYGDDETLNAVWADADCVGTQCTVLTGTGQGSTLAAVSGEFNSNDVRAWLGGDFTLERRCDTQAIVAPFTMIFHGTRSASTQTQGTGTASTVIRAHPADPEDNVMAAPIATAAAGTSIPHDSFTFPYADVGILPEGQRHYRPSLSIESETETGAAVDEIQPSAQASGAFQLTSIDIVFGDETGPVPAFTWSSVDETPQGVSGVFKGWYQEPVTVTTDAPDPIEANGMAIANSCTKKIELFADTLEVHEEDELEGGSTTYSFSTDGRFDVSAIAWDYAGNAGPSAALVNFEFGIDRVAPTSAPALLEPSTPNGLDGWYRIPIDATPAVRVSRTCSDPALADGEAGSGCQGVFWRFGGGSYQNGGASIQKTFAQGANVTFDSYAPDNAGNGDVTTALQVGPLKVDLTAPSRIISGETANGWHKGVADKVRIYCSYDQHSTCEPLEDDEYQCNGVDFARIVAPYAIRDKAGNWVNGTLPNGFGCDATRPTIAGTPVLTVPFHTVSGKKHTNVTPVWEFDCSTDAMSGVASYEIRINGAVKTSLPSACPTGKLSYTLSPAVPNVEYCVRAVAIDHAGNRDAGVGAGTCVTYDNLAPDLTWAVPQSGLYWENVFIPVPVPNGEARVLGDLDLKVLTVDEVGTFGLELWERDPDLPADTLRGSCPQQDVAQCVWQDHPTADAITWDTQNKEEAFAVGWDYARNRNYTEVVYWRLGFATLSHTCEQNAQQVCAAILTPVLMNAPGAVATVYKSTDLATLFDATKVLTTVPTTAKARVDDSAVTAGNTYYYGLKVTQGLTTKTFAMRYTHSSVHLGSLAEVVS